jgi:hypothetical protein
LPSYSPLLHPASVIPVQTGIQPKVKNIWIPAFAGMTSRKNSMP